MANYFCRHFFRVFGVFLMPLVFGALTSAHASGSTLISPLSEIKTSQPEFVWHENKGATVYRLFVWDQSIRQRVHLKNYSAKDICYYGTCSVSPDINLGYGVSHRWWVRSRTKSGWTSPVRGSFKYVESPPASPSIVAPVKTVTTASPTYEWIGLSNADKYQVVVRDIIGRKTLLNKSFNASEVCDSNACALTPDLILPVSKKILLRVRAANTGGWGPFTRHYFSYAGLKTISPVANNENVNIEQGETVTIDVLQNDEGEIDPSSVFIVDGPFNASAENGVIINQDGSITYKHSANGSLSDTIVYKVRGIESELVSNSATVHINIAPPPPPAPIIAVNDFVSISQGETVIIDVLQNDTGEIDASSIFLVNGPFNAALNGLTVNTNGTISYTHNDEGSLTDIIVYRVRGVNSEVVSNEATVTVTIAPPVVTNEAPLAIADTATVVADAFVSIAVLDNDTDTDGVAGIAPNTLSVVTDSGPANGTVSISGGLITYTPDAGTAALADSFRYTVKDTEGLESNAAEVTITITPVVVPNEAPVAVADSAEVVANESVEITVLSNDTDTDGVAGIDSGTVTLVTGSGPAFGSISINNGGVITYTPAEGTTETSDSFSYTVKDTEGLESNAAEVSITITPVVVPNEAPIAVADSAGVVANESVEIAVLSNDTDTDGVAGIDPGTVTLVAGSGPAFGSVSINNGVITYTPAEGTAETSDSFGYTVKDTEGLESNTAEVTITITPVVVPNEAPIAVADAVSVAADGSVDIIVLSNDTDTDGIAGIDPATVDLVTDSGPAFGSLSISNSVITYTPVEGTTETTDSFSYTVKDTAGLESNAAEVTITITPVVVPNVAPLAVADSAEVVVGESVGIPVLANDTDNDGVAGIDPSTVTIVQVPTSGTTQINAGIVTYTPEANTTADSDSFSYTVKDAEGLESNVAEVTITINPAPVLNEAPVAVADAVSVAADGVVNIFVLSNDTDDDGVAGIDPTTVALVPNMGPASGAVQINADGTITYTPTVGTTALSDSFSYVVADSEGAVSNTAEVIIEIEPLPAVIVANDDTLGISRGETIIIDILANDTGPLNPGGVFIVVSPEHAEPNTGFEISIVDGTVTYAHNGNSSLVDTFVYQVTGVDAEIISNEATVTINIEQPVIVNVPPVAVDDTAVVTLGESVTFDVVANDSDADGVDDIIPASVVVVSPPGSGILVNNENGTFTYIPAADTAAVSDTFTYTVADAAADVSNTATVIITIERPIVPEELFAFHRDGQTFLTWGETATTDQYHVYRSSSPITSDTLVQATKVTERWGPLSSDTSVNTTGGSNAPAFYVIEDDGLQLDANTGLFVYTTQTGDSATAYYAVTTVTGGTEDLSRVLTFNDAVQESVSTTSDVLTDRQRNGRALLYTQFMDYSQWNPTFNGYAYNYSVVLPPNYSAAQSYPLLVQPHAFGEYFKFSDNLESFELDRNVIQLFPNDPGTSVGEVHSWWYGYAADHNYETNGSIPTSGKIENFTEQRVMRSINEVSSNFSVDRNFIHAFGNSMGASGVLSWGMRYPSVFSGVYASQPMTDYRDSPTFQEDLVQLWGAQAANLPITNAGLNVQDISIYEGVGVWDWMDHHQQLVARRGDTFAYLMVSHGKQDQVLTWNTQGIPTVRALTEANAAFSAVNSEEGHAWSAFDAVNTIMFGFGFDADFNWKYPLNLSFPAIQNASGSSSIDPANTGVDTYNLNIEWSVPHNSFGDPIVDQANRYEVTLRSTDAPQTAEITPRRTQQFSVNGGDVCNWSALDAADNAVLNSGTVTADADSLITVAGFPILTGLGSRLVIDCP